MSVHSRSRVSDVLDSSLIRSIRPDIAISSSRVNRDNLRPDVSITRGDLLSSLEEIDKKAKDRIRPQIDASRGLASIRLVPQQLSRDSNGMSARSYRPTDYASNMPNKKRSEAERAYIIRQKFIDLNHRNPKIDIPDTQDPDALERMYMEALKTYRRTKVGASWFIYIGIGYFILQYILQWFGLNLPDNFALYQMRAIAHYTDIIRQMGDPGGISIGSSWPAWAKLLIVMVLQTITFIIAYKITGSEQAAAGAQDFIASTNFMGGNKSDGDLEAEGAALDIGNIISNFKGAMGGGGGNIIQSVMSMFGGGKPKQDIDLDDIPEPEAESFSSRRPNPFDE